MASRRVNLSESDLRAAGLDGLFDELDAAVEDHLDGAVSNVAVIADPFAGREVLVEYADEAFGAASGRVSLDGMVTSLDDVEFPDTEVVLVDGCHHLYTRQINGYDVLDEFLSMIVDRDAMFVTAWNRYAWDYLTAIRDVEHVIPVHVRVPSLDAAGTSELLLNHYGPQMPAFVETGDAGRVKTLDVERRSISLPADRSVSVPLPALNLEYLTARSNTETYGDVEAVVFEKLTALADGNPGAACRLWERSVRDGEVAPAYVQEVETTLDLNEDQAFVLELLVAKEELTVPALRDIVVNVPVERALGTLVQQEVLALDGDRVSLVPERLKAVVTHLRGRQLIW